MEEETAGVADYGNWVSTRIILLPLAIGLAFAALSLVEPLLLILSALFLLVSAYFAYAHYLFSPRGKDVQRQVRQLVLDKLAWDGKGQALDIGCGNGALVIALARSHPASRIVGIDYWGEGWEYSKRSCERNAEAENVSKSTSFLKASASSLPFPDESFDAVVSNLTFHEVRDASDKRKVVMEALRVLRKGGSFCFQDLFEMERVYGDIEDLLATIESAGIEKVDFVRTSDARFIPLALKLPFMVGTMGIISGVK